MTWPARRLLGVQALRRAAARAAVRRGHGLALVYHRVHPDGWSPSNEIVPGLTRAQLAGHLAVLADLGELVPLSDLPAAGSSRPAFAVTFDDDYPSHVSVVLPVLGSAARAATFFLCGRALHGRGAYWWQRLEALLAAEGAPGAARALGVDGADPSALAAACERDPGLQQRLSEVAPASGEGLLDADGLRRLGDSAAVGFHTVDHPLLPLLDDDAIGRALSDGRERLEQAVGRRCEQVAYPHGKADARCAAAARAAGYLAAWTGRPGPVRSDDDPFLRNRWEPGALDPDAFAVGVVARLHTTAPDGAAW